MQRKHEAKPLTWSGLPRPFQTSRQEDTGVKFDPLFLDLNYWQTMVMLYRHSLAVPEQLAGELDESTREESRTTTYADAEDREDEQLVFYKAGVAGQQVEASHSPVRSGVWSPATATPGVKSDVTRPSSSLSRDAESVIDERESLKADRERDESGVRQISLSTVLDNCIILEEFLKELVGIINADSIIRRPKDSHIFQLLSFRASFIVVCHRTPLSFYVHRNNNGSQRLTEAAPSCHRQQQELLALQFRDRFRLDTPANT